MIIQDITVITPEGAEYTFTGVASREANVLAPGLPVILEFKSALGQILGAVIMGPGIMLIYNNHVAATSQVDALSGKLLIKSEYDS